MQFIQKLSLFLLILTCQPTVSSAIVAPTKQIVKTHKLKFKEKAAIWLLKRKLRKVKKHLNDPLTSFAVRTDTTDCATILLNTGDKLEVKLIKTTEYDVVFRRCKKRESIITMSKSDIYQIVLSDGLVVYDSNKIPVKSKKSNHSSPNYGYGILALLTGLFSLMLLSTFPAVSIVFAFIVALLGYLSYKRHKKKDQGLGITAMLLSVVLLLVSILKKNS